MINDNKMKRIALTAEIINDTIEYAQTRIKSWDEDIEYYKQKYPDFENDIAAESIKSNIYECELKKQLIQNVIKYLNNYKF